MNFEPNASLFELEKAEERVSVMGIAPITFTVYGNAQPAGSKRGFARRRGDGSSFISIVDANPKSRDWKNAVTSAARDFYKGDLLDCPINLKLIFYRPRAQGHFGAKGVRASAPAYPTTRPDVLKLARAVEDALTGVIYRDDSQIVTETLIKRFGEPSRVEIVIQYQA
jgi:Holliday junction resolvase RusA-like endonuclease